MYDKRDNRGLPLYAHYLGVSYPKLISIIREGARPFHKTRVLDVGCGRGVAISDMVRAFTHQLGCDVEAEGLTAVQNNFGIRNPAIRTGIIEKFVREKRYDLILSVQTIGYSSNKPLAFQNICNSLRVGGKAIIELPDYDYPADKRIQLVTELRQKGFVVGKTENPSVLVIVRKNPKKLNLSRLFPKEMEDRF